MRLIPNSRRGALWRFALGAVIVIGFTAAATAVAGLLAVQAARRTTSSVAPALKQARVTIPDPGNPQTILIIGSDHRAGTRSRPPNTDTMMLVRLDPNSSTINVISIPRDLRVADSAGRGARDGQAQQRLFDRRAEPAGQGDQAERVPACCRSITSSMSTSAASRRWSNAIGCVYTDVDHRYYNNTAADRLLEHRPPARLPEAVRRRRALVRALSATPTATSCATPASRTSSAGPRTSTARRT